MTFSFSSILYLNVRHMLLRWPADLLRTWPGWSGAGRG
jgi:hypothetical protein